MDAVFDFSSVPNAPKSCDIDALSRLREALRAVNFTYDGVEQLLGERAFEAMARDMVVPGTYRLRQIQESDASAEQKNLATVVAFFLLAHSVSEKNLNTALRPVTFAGLKDLGLAESHEGLVRATVDLRPHSADDGTELWVASDLGAHQRPGVLRKDHVLGIGHASLTLAQITERTAVQKALDLGTGCGIQTFHLLAHAQHVTATDISERALAFTRFNLVLNAPTLDINPQNLDARVSLRLGSLLEPVAGEKFDLVISNPPFVITPRKSEETPADQYTYRDGGMAGDGIVSTLVQQLPTVLNEGGRAQMLGNWEIPVDGESWADRPRQWVGENTEAWFIQREVLTPEQYAETWLKDASENRDPQLFESAYMDYLRDFSARGVDSIGFGMIWLRKPTAAALDAHRQNPHAQVLLQRFEEITYPVQQPLAPFMTQAVARHDALAQLDDSELASLYLTAAEDVTEERHAEPGAEHPSVIILRQGAGLRRTVVETSETSGFVSACDGELAAGQIINALASILEWDELPADQNPKFALLLHIRELVRDGFLVFDEDEIN
ncbi:DUF7059 domain-containing protein [Rothia terrae]|uniref:DUF7059 domain-containing protein n=1 Tax=Rothia terrae TaxID=396015 RepID=UPI0033F6971E